MNDWLIELRKKHEDYMIKWRKSGSPIILYNTPCCDKEMETTAPSDNETWTSATNCPWCGELFMKIVTRREVETHNLTLP